MIYRLVFTSLFLLSLPIIGQAQEKSLHDLVNHRQYSEAILFADNLTTADSTDYATMYSLAQAYDGLLMYRAAYSYYHHCYMMDTANIDILNPLARAAVNMGRATEAEGFYKKVLATDSLNFYANHQLARLYYQTGNYQEATIIYQRLIETNDRNPALLSALGDCFTKQEMLLPATSSYFLAYNYNRENVTLASALINSLLRLGGDYKPDALAICDTALHYNPNNKLLMQNKGMALYANERYADADTSYTQLMAEGDSSYLTLKYAGMSKYYAGQFYKAIEPFEAAYLQDTTSVEVCLYLGSSLGKTYDRKRAFEMLDKAEEAMKTPDIYLRFLKTFRAETYRRDNDYETSCRLYYELWKENQRIDYLTNIFEMNGRKESSSEVDRSEALFINILYAEKMLERNDERSIQFLSRMRKQLLSVYNEMFFSLEKSATLLAPDGKKSTITMQELLALIEKMPESE